MYLPFARMVHGPAATDPRDAVSVSPDIFPLQEYHAAAHKVLALAIGDFRIHRSPAESSQVTLESPGSNRHRGLAIEHDPLNTSVLLPFRPILNVALEYAPDVGLRP